MDIDSRTKLLLQEDFLLVKQVYRIDNEVENNIVLRAYVQFGSENLLNHGYAYLLLGFWLAGLYYFYYLQKRQRKDSSRVVAEKIAVESKEEIKPLLRKPIAWTHLGGDLYFDEQCGVLKRCEQTIQLKNMNLLYFRAFLGKEHYTLTYEDFLMVVYGQKSGIVADNSQVSIRKKLDGKLTMVNGAYFADVNITAKDAVNIVGTDDYGIQAKNSLSVIELIDSALPKDVNLKLNVTSQGTINVLGGNAGIMATAVKDEFNNGVLKPLSNTDFGSKVNLTANGDIAVQGGDYGVIAFENSNVDITSKNGNVLIGATDTNAEKVSNTAAVYAENGANTQSTVNINAANGVVTVLSGNKGLWASGKGGTINVDGAVNINANYFADESATRSAGEDVHLAVVAGVKSPEEGQNGKGLVDINLKGDVTSSIYGDIVGARGGKVKIKRESGNGALVVNGDVLAGNGGTVRLDIGKNGMLTGRIDDYMDASDEHGNSFFAPQFSYEIKDSGKVDLKLGDGSRWNVDGQSWVTTINAGKNTVIDLTGAATDRNTTAHALTIGTLNGDANFRMNLDGFDKANSDMLYIKNSNGEYNVILDDAVTSEEIGETGLRFATIEAKMIMKIITKMTFIMAGKNLMK